MAYSRTITISIEGAAWLEKSGDTVALEAALVGLRNDLQVLAQEALGDFKGLTVDAGMD